MTKTLNRPSAKGAKGYTLGRTGFAKISAVEGIKLSPEMEARFRDFDKRGLSAHERRVAIARAFGKVR
jgi:hypothetical protein